MLSLQWYFLSGCFGYWLTTPSLGGEGGSGGYNSKGGTYFVFQKYFSFKTWHIQQVINWNMSFSRSPHLWVCGTQSMWFSKSLESLLICRGAASSQKGGVLRVVGTNLKGTQIWVFTVKIAFHCGLCDSCLTPVSSVCKAALMFLLWAPNGLNKLPEMSFEFLFTLISKLTKTVQQSKGGATQILLHQWGPSTRIAALFRR